MLTVYVLFALVGSAFVLSSALLGGDHDSDVDHEAEHDFDHGAAAGHADDPGGAWLPFLSLRFWTYFAAVFGLVGAILTGLGSAGSGAVAGLAVGSGLLVGTSVSAALRFLKSTQTHSGAVPHDFEGTMGRILVPVARDRPGKVRCSIRGELIDLVAVTAEDEAIPGGAQVFVLGVEEGRARVATQEGLERQLRRRREERAGSPGDDEGVVIDVTPARPRDTRGASRTEEP